MSKQCWNHVSSGKIMLDIWNVYHTDRAGLKTLASILEQHWARGGLLLKCIYTNCDRDSQKQHKDMTRQELRKHWHQRQAQPPLNCRYVDSLWVWLEMSMWACSSSCLAFFLFQTPSSCCPKRALNYSAFQIHFKYISSSNLKRRGGAFCYTWTEFDSKFAFWMFSHLWAVENAHFV